MVSFMDTMKKHMYIHESEALSPIKSQQPSSMPVSDNGFPILAIAVLGIMATAFLLVSYYIFVTRCCYNCQQVDPLRRFIRRARQHEDPLMAYSPSWQSRGLDEVLIRQLPTFQYARTVGQESSFSKCVVCLNEFQDQDLLRLLPKCSHAFHLDCIDIWLQSNTSCPLCRSSISGRNRYPIDRIVAPNSSPQDPQPYIESLIASDEDFVVIDFTGQDDSAGGDSSARLGQSRSHSLRKFEPKIGKSKPRKFHRVSMMGDECIDVRDKDDQFSIQPIRRSFSMDSAADCHVYLSVQEILRQNRLPNEVRNNEESSSSTSRVRRSSFFSFGHGRGSRSAVLPIEF